MKAQGTHEVQRWLLLRGLTREKQHWGAFLREFERQFPLAEICAVDLPGCGQFCKEVSPFSIQGIAAHILKRQPLREWQRDGKTFGIFGLSMGGLVALELAQKVKFCQRIVLVNSSLTSLSPLWHRLRPSAFLQLILMFSRWECAQRENVMLQVTSEKFSTHVRTQAEWRHIHLQRPVTRISAVAQFIATARYVPQKTQIGRVKALVLSGNMDRLVNPKCSLRIAGWLNSTFVTHPDAGHDLTLDDPAWVCSQVAEWVSRSSL